MKTAYKFWWINHSGKIQVDYFTSEEKGFDWIERYGVEYFDHIRKNNVPNEIILL
jgi:hypothetical protein